jgi:hypothetical protein
MRIKRMWKEVVMAKLGFFYPGIFLEELRKKHKMPMKVFPNLFDVAVPLTSPFISHGTP